MLGSVKKELEQSFDSDCTDFLDQTDYLSFLI